MSALLSTLAAALIPAAGSILTGLVSMALIKIKAYVATKTKNELVDAALTRITHTVNTTVAGITQTMVAELKAASVDGKLPDDAALAVKAAAFNAVMAQLPEAVKTDAMMGVNSLVQLVNTKIEAAVLAQKVGV